MTRIIDLETCLWTCILASSDVMTILVSSITPTKASQRVYTWLSKVPTSHLINALN